LSVIEGSRGGDKPWGLLAFFNFCVFCFRDPPLTLSERAENSDSV